MRNKNVSMFFLKHQKKNTIREVCCEMGMCQGGGSQKRLGEAEESTSGIFSDYMTVYDVIYNDI